MTTPAAPVAKSAAFRTSRFFGLFALLLQLPFLAPAQPPPAALTAFRTASLALEAQLRARPMLAGADAAQPQPGQVVVEKLGWPEYPVSEPPGALLHRWRARTFLPGATPAALLHLLLDLPAYPRVFAPQIVSARVLVSTPGRLEAVVRSRQRHGLTVVLDLLCDIRFDAAAATSKPAQGFFASRTVRVDEIAGAGTPEEHALPANQQHGFLWAQDTFWRFSTRSGGLLVEVDSLSLTRDVPPGLGWAVRPFAESIPRDALRFTLERVAEALHNHP